MRAWIQDDYGSTEAYRLVDLPMPEPAAGEVQVRVGATAINDWEVGMLRLPLVIRPLVGWRRPRGKFRTMGCDMAGVVTATGAGVSRFKTGDRVYGDLSGYRFGAFAETVCVTEKNLAHTPDNIDDLTAAAIPHAAELAVQAIRSREPLKAGQRVLINGAAGGVGTLAVQMLLPLGVELTGVDRREKWEYLQELGYHHVLDYRDQDFTRSGEKYDFILDAKTNKPAFAYRRALNPGGTYATVGGEKLIRYVTSALFTRFMRDKHLKLIALKPNINLVEISQWLEEGKLKPRIQGPYAFTEVPAALEYFRSGRHEGKVVVAVNPDSTTEAST